MFKKYLSLVLAGIILFVALPQSSLARPGTDEILEKVKADVRKIGTGHESKVVVTWKNGTRLKGHISQILDDSFDLTDSTTKQAKTILYGDVAKVRKQGGSNATKIALGIGLGAVIVTAIVIGIASKKGLSGVCPLGCGPF